MPTPTPIKIVKRALWKPHWYKLDQPIGLGQFSRFAFERESTATTPWGDPYDYTFYNRTFSNKRTWSNEGILSDEELPQYRFARVLEIVHPVLGSLERVDTGGLDYIFYPLEGAELVVNAEEEPGVAYDDDRAIQDWELSVTLDDVSEPVGETF